MHFLNFFAEMLGKGKMFDVSLSSRSANGLQERYRSAKS